MTKSLEEIAAVGVARMREWEEGERAMGLPARDQRYEATVSIDLANSAPSMRRARSELADLGPVAVVSGPLLRVRRLLTRLGLGAAISAVVALPPAGTTRVIAIAAEGVMDAIVAVP